MLLISLLFAILVTEEWKEVQTTGVPPLPRAAASLVVIGTKLYLFGGLSHAVGWFDDLFTFDIGKLT